jgi:uncharacterized protein (TIGR03066 family)
MSSTAAAEDKKDDRIDAKLLIGRWVPKERKDGASMVLTFLKDGKATLDATDGGQETKNVGTYTADGATLVLVMTADGKERTLERRIARLTADELVLKNETGMEQTFVRVRDRDKK